MQLLVRGCISLSIPSSKQGWDDLKKVRARAELVKPELESNSSCHSQREVQLESSRAQGQVELNMRIELQSSIGIGSHGHFCHRDNHASC